MQLLLGLVAFLGQGTLPLLHSLLFAFALEATLRLVLGLFLSLIFKLLAPRPFSLTTQPLSCCLARHNIARLAETAFLTHFLVYIPDAALKLREARTSLDSFLLLLHLLHLPHDGRHLTLLSRQIASFAIPPQFLVLLPLSLIKLWARCLSFLSSLSLRSVVFGGVRRVGRSSLIAHCRLRAHYCRLELDYFRGLSRSLGRSPAPLTEKRRGPLVCRLGACQGLVLLWQEQEQGPGRQGLRAGPE